MIIHLRFFATLRERAGCAETTREVPASATVAETWARICDENSALEDVRDAVSFAVNLEYVPARHVLAEGDELALIPPVSGG